MAINTGSISIIDMLLQHGANPHTFDEKGYQAIHEAALNGNVEVLAHLVNNGIASRLAPSTLDSLTPLDISAVAGHSPMVRWLLQKEEEEKDEGNLPSAPTPSGTKRPL